jgi:3-methylfumaryl-CoA hydratase
MLGAVTASGESLGQKMDGTIERTGLITPEPAYALGALLGVPVPALAHGAALPLLWHWLYLLDRPAQADLGPDGSPARGTLASSPGPGRRRMWAGGRVQASGPLGCGQWATRRSRLSSVQDKQGRSGPLTFMTVEHEILQNDRVVITEQQDIVYRPAAAPGGPPPPPADDRVIQVAAGERAIDISPTLLFRFSALTYNAHRIHYDRDYARDVEGYPGLLTHGPLQALAMAEMARATGGPGQDGSGLSFEYRLISPLFDHQGMVVGAARGPDGTVTGVRDRGGRATAAGTLRMNQ